MYVCMLARARASLSLQTTLERTRLAALPSRPRIRLSKDAQAHARDGHHVLSGDRL